MLLIPIICFRLPCKVLPYYSIMRTSKHPYAVPSKTNIFLNLWKLSNVWAGKWEWLRTNRSCSAHQKYHKLPLEALCYFTHYQYWFLYSRRRNLLISYITKYHTIACLYRGQSSCPLVNRSLFEEGCQKQQNFIQSAIFFPFQQTL